ncbi:MAG: hypothetical protein JNK02_17095 [Planctomycetes bacterium]|nr:hypothetical protein [Planctomycetota bacterium]
MKLLPKMALAAAAISGLSLSAFAGAGAPEAGSLLLYPCFDSNRGSDTIITVTNTNADFAQVGQLFAGTVDVEFVYIQKYDCLEFNRTRRLTPNDTLSVLARLDNPNQREGYVYVFAKSPITGAAISWNWLIGIGQIDSAVGSAVDVNPYVFKAVGAQGANTDVNSDGLRNLDGVEYEAAPDRILVPRFFGQQDQAMSLGSGAQSKLVLINLTGAARFTAVVDFLIYNDNEEVFSAQYDFRCWKKVDLDRISGAFTQSFLLSTNHNPLESILGTETGWFRMNGNLAYSSADSVQDPAILSALFEELHGATGELPFVSGTQTNGELVSQSVFHD